MDEVETLTCNTGAQTVRNIWEVVLKVLKSRLFQIVFQRHNEVLMLKQAPLARRVISSSESKTRKGEEMKVVDVIKVQGRESGGA